MHPREKLPKGPRHRPQTCLAQPPRQSRNRTLPTWTPQAVGPNEVTVRGTSGKGSSPVPADGDVGASWVGESYGDSRARLLLLGPPALSPAPPPWRPHQYADPLGLGAAGGHEEGGGGDLSRQR